MRGLHCNSTAGKSACVFVLVSFFSHVVGLHNMVKKNHIVISLTEVTTGKAAPFVGIIIFGLKFSFLLKKKKPVLSSGEQTFRPGHLCSSPVLHYNAVFSHTFPLSENCDLVLGL